MRFGADRKTDTNGRKRDRAVRLIVIDQAWWLTLEEAQILRGQLNKAVFEAEVEAIARREAAKPKPVAVTEGAGDDHG